MRLFALRGANSVERNDAESILSATDELMRELMARNELTPEAMVSCIFTLTEDLDAEFPAVAARARAAPRAAAVHARGTGPGVATPRDPHVAALLRTSRA